jgi:hypothetical protein
VSSPPWAKIGRGLHSRTVSVVLAQQRGRGCYGHRDATMILVAYRHGLRASEVPDVTDLWNGRRPKPQIRPGRLAPGNRSVLVPAHLGKIGDLVDVSAICDAVGRPCLGRGGPMSELPPNESSIPAGADPGRRKAAAYEAHGAQSFPATSATRRAHSLPRPVHSFVRRPPLTDVFIELDAGGNLLGDSIEREIISRHAAIGIKAEGYRLSDGSRFRGSGQASTSAHLARTGSLAHYWPSGSQGYVLTRSGSVAGT